MQILAVIATACLIVVNAQLLVTATIVLATIEAINRVFSK